MNSSLLEVSRRLEAWRPRHQLPEQSAGEVRRDQLRRTPILPDREEIVNVGFRGLCV